MFPIIGAAIAGAILMGRTKPKTRAVKKVVLGAHSGVTYTVEEFPEAGFVVVRAADGAVAVFARTMAKDRQDMGGAFRFRSGSGPGHTVERMKLDFLRPSQPQPQSTRG